MLDGHKMAKSVGNLVLVNELLEDAWRPAVIRLLLIDRPWHAAWEYRPSDLAVAADRLDHLWSRAGKPTSDAAAEHAAFAALLDNLDVPLALTIAEEAGGQTLRSIGAVLGLF